jgi:hypothetical protein
MYAYSAAVMILCMCAILFLCLSVSPFCTRQVACIDLVACACASCAHSLKHNDIEYELEVQIYDLLEMGAAARHAQGAHPLPTGCLVPVADMHVAFRCAANRLRQAHLTHRRSARGGDAFAAFKQTVENALAALPVYDLHQCQLCLVPMTAAHAIRLPGCVHAICTACAAQVVMDLPSFFDCLLCTRTSIFRQPPRPTYVAIVSPETAVPCATHADRKATAYCHTCQAPICTKCSPHPSHHATKEATDPAGARACLDMAFAAMDELAARGAEAAMASTRVNSHAALARSTVGGLIAALQARLQKRRDALLASVYEQSASLETATVLKAAVFRFDATMTTGDVSASVEEDGDGKGGGKAKRSKRTQAPANATTTLTDSNEGPLFPVAEQLPVQWQTELAALQLKTAKTSAPLASLQ